MFKKTSFDRLKKINNRFEKLVVEILKRDVENIQRLKNVLESNKHSGVRNTRGS